MNVESCMLSSHSPPIDSWGKVTWLLFVSVCISIACRDHSHTRLSSLVEVFSELLSGYDKQNLNSLWRCLGTISQAEIPSAEGDSVYVKIQGLARYAVFAFWLVPEVTTIRGNSTWVLRHSSATKVTSLYKGFRSHGCSLANAIEIEPLVLLTLRIS